MSTMTESSSTSRRTQKESASISLYCIFSFWYANCPPQPSLKTFHRFFLSQIFGIKMCIYNRWTKIYLLSFTPILRTCCERIWHIVGIAGNRRSHTVQQPLIAKVRALALFQSCHKLGSIMWGQIGQELGQDKEGKEGVCPYSFSTKPSVYRAQLNALLWMQPSE